MASGKGRVVGSYGPRVGGLRARGWDITCRRSAAPGTGPRLSWRPCWPDTPRARHASFAPRCSFPPDGRDQGSGLRF